MDLRFNIFARPQMALVLGLLGAARALAEAPRDDSDAPYVRILQSTGSIDGPSEGGVAVPRWERLHLELHVDNHLPVAIDGLEVDVALVSSSGTPGASASPIPGWSFRETFDATPIPGEDQAFLRMVRDLPARRTSPPADEITYRVRIRSYRLSPPDLETAIRLLGSPKNSDQRAALRSYDRESLQSEETIAALGQSVAKSIRALPEIPSAFDALRMLFSIRALGTLGDASKVLELLELPDRRERRAWGQAVVDLAGRMTSASESTEPRLRVLPSWARERSPLLNMRAADALEEATRDAILRMGDAAVPALLKESQLGVEPTSRARARSLLHALGRTTVRSQLALRDRAARIGVITVLGQLGTTEPVPALAEVLRGPDRELRAAAQSALERIGTRAIEPLVDTLGTHNDTPVLEVIQAFDRVAHGEVVRAAARFGILPQPKESPGRLPERIQQHLFSQQRSRLVVEVDRALDLGREGSFTEAFSLLDAVFARDRDLYMTYAERIAQLYLDRARRLFGSGDFDAAIASLRTGQSLHHLGDATDMLVAAQLQLARGYLDLGELERAEETLKGIDPSIRSAEVRHFAARLLGQQSKAALDRGDYGKARTTLDRARTLAPGDPDLELQDRKLLITENLAIVIVLSLLLPVLGLAIVLRFRRRFEAARLERLAKAIDQA